MTCRGIKKQMTNPENIIGATWYVYRHIREDKNVPFYIGIGCKKNYGRATEYSLDKRNIYWNRIVNKTNWKVQILFSELTKEDASNKEKELIKLYGRVDNLTGILCNMTDGGDGIFGCPRSEETKRKLRESKLGSKNYFYGKSESEETRIIRVKSFKENWKNKTEHEKKIIIKNRGDGVVKSQGKAVFVYEYLTEIFVGEYDSISYACRCLGLEGRDGKASLVCRGLRGRVGNYVFKYKSDVLNKL